MSDYRALSSEPGALVCDGGLAGLPPDVLIRIIGYLHPLDIIMLRMVCRYLRDVTLQRTVWYKALQQSMLRNDVSLPIFPLADMSPAELEHAALTPVKFSRLVKRGVRILGEREMTQDTPPVPKLRPDAQRTMLIDIEGAPNAVLRPNLTLLPGGRYTIITTNEAIHIVDLGYRAYSAIDKRPVFTLRRSDLKGIEMTDATTWHVDQWSANGRTGNLLLFISVQQPSTSPQLGAIVIYKVVDLAGAPTGHQVARLTLPRRFRPRVHHIEGSRVCFGSEIGTIGVWDFVRNRAIRWRTQSTSATNLTVLSGGSVIHCDPSTGRYIYKVPPLKPTLNGAIQRPIVEPAITIDEVPPRPSFIRSPRCSFATHLNSKWERFYDVRGLDGQVQRFAVIDLTPRIPQAPKGMPYPVSTFKAHQDPESYVEVTYLPHLHVCEDGVFTGSQCSGFLAGDLGPLYHGAGISLHISGRDYGEDAKGIDAAVTLLDYEDPEYWPEWYPDGIDFCPVSGRLCAVEHVDGKLNLSVFDYIVPCA